MKYRKKPVIIEAFQYHQWSQFAFAPKWLKEAIAQGIAYKAEDGKVFIKTLEGDMGVANGTYIIRGVENEIYACDPSIFLKTYDPVYEDEEDRLFNDDD